MKDILKLAVVLTVIAGIAGAALAVVNDVTKGPIAEVKRQAKLAALKKVLTVEFDNSPDSDEVAIELGQDKKGNPVKQVFNIARKGGQVVGLAFEVVAPDGYAGNITTMVGVNVQGEVLGIEMLAHAETPGLGDVYGKPKFTEQAKGKTVKDDWRPKKDGGVFDTNSGATVTPRAMLASVGRGLKLVEEHHAELMK